MPPIHNLNVKSLHQRRIDPMRRIFVRDLVLQTRIGVHEHEKQGSQRIRVNLEVVARLDETLHDELRNTICYDDISQAIRRLAIEGHIKLVESFAERVLEICLSDPRARHATVTVEKLDVYDDAGGVGVTMSADAG
ncbi:MAG: dihydroneopterin aldolase [Acidocella sp.]|nr:dihydroneopterin aldolase [Acidocella sp.]